MAFVIWGAPWLIAVVGPVLSNVVLGVPVAVLGALWLRSQRREYRRMEAERKATRTRWFGRRARYPAS